MLECFHIEFNSKCTTFDYEQNPDKYRGMIYCLECRNKAWFIRGYNTDKMSRTACFAAHHSENCTISTIEIGHDDSDELLQDESQNSSDIRVDLDKTVNSSIYVSTDNNKHNEEESDWKTNKQKKPLGNSSGFPLNKSLRQILTNLCNNAEYAEKGQTISIIADSGRVVLEGQLKSYLVKIEQVTREHLGRTLIFWGTVNNLNIDPTGNLWLNYGDYRKEPSIRFEPYLKDQLLRNFKLKDVSDLDGSDVIIVGHVGFSQKNKAVIRTAFTKYISFRKIQITANH
jgi:hypothetical protein